MAAPAPGTPACLVAGLKPTTTLASRRNRDSRERSSWSWVDDRGTSCCGGVVGIYIVYSVLWCAVVSVEQWMVHRFVLQL